MPKRKSPRRYDLFGDYPEKSKSTDWFNVFNLDLSKCDQKTRLRALHKYIRMYIDKVFGMPSHSALNLEYRNPKLLEQPAEVRLINACNALTANAMEIINGDVINDIVKQCLRGTNPDTCVRISPKYLNDWYDRTKEEFKKLYLDEADAEETRERMARRMANILEPGRFDDADLQLPEEAKQKVDADIEELSQQLRNEQLSKRAMEIIAEENAA